MPGKLEEMHGATAEKELKRSSESTDKQGNYTKHISAMQLCQFGGNIYIQSMWKI